MIHEEKVHGENKKLEVRRQEIGRYLEKLGSLRLGDKK